MNKDQIVFDRGSEDIVFIETDIENSEIADVKNPEKILEEKLEDKGLKLENASITGFFRDELAIHLKDNSKIFLDGEQVYPD